MEFSYKAATKHTHHEERPRGSLIEVYESRFTAKLTIC